MYIIPFSFAVTYRRNAALAPRATSRATTGHFRSPLLSPVRGAQPTCCSRLSIRPQERHGQSARFRVFWPQTADAVCRTYDMVLCAVRLARRCISGTPTPIHPRGRRHRRDKLHRRDASRALLFYARLRMADLGKEILDFVSIGACLQEGFPCLFVAIRALADVAAHRFQVRRRSGLRSSSSRLC